VCCTQERAPCVNKTFYKRDVLIRHIYKRDIDKRDVEKRTRKEIQDRDLEQNIGKRLRKDM